LKNRAQLEAITESLMQAWNAHDAGALCALYAADADFIDESGALIQGRDAIYTHYEDCFRGIFARSLLAVTAVKVRMLTPRMALLHTVWSMRGHDGHGVQWLPVRTGTLLLICARRDAKWELVLAHSSCGAADTTR
jgi:uncharacterized protein (TIGR02246 family)